MAFQKLESKPWKYAKDGDKITGKFINVRHDVGQFESTVYTIKEDDGKFTDVFGSKVLDDQMKLADLGDRIQIIYKGIPKGKSYHTFEVYKDDGQ